jgi:glycosyltransferase involved in cell wall biosynthesis
MSGDLKYGPSFNKMFEYLAAGHPILTTLQTPYSIILSNNCGIMTQDNTAESIENSIRKLIALPQEKLIEMGCNAREAAKKYDFVVLTDMLISVIEKGEEVQ